MMSGVATPNRQYSLIPPRSLRERMVSRARHKMFDRFMVALRPEPGESVLDIGATSDEIHEASNYFEALYPFKDKIVACGIDDAKSIEVRFPDVRFVRADACNLPFADRSFDLVHSSAVLEHVGSSLRQERMISECLRVARAACS